ncbi:N-acetylmuramoyl-L-alanine amidase [Bacillus sp. 31A1R]|uniref:N-acetylmuramoyl-L-alanine amidase n=1 Tax=Robertmurraya mangrovi TaxID=3098077 RepID=A0ABU5IXN4_9BACI|nr:SH3 domain-containing protein [Bacillus sp. 31A1R]MDZ5471909.1 N-acetylmuramoyl-L-alanine amidase [Bacillus sp. 31A1R]
MMSKNLLTRLICFILVFTLFTPTFGQKTAEAASVGWKVNADVLNVREKPGTKYKIVGKLKKNQTVTLQERKGSWSKVTYGKKTAWVASKYITYKAWSGYVSASTLNVRKSPTTKSSVVSKLKKGTKVKIVAQQGSWLQISYKNTKGWVSSTYVTNKVVKANVTKPKSSIGDYYVTATLLNIRSKPSTSSDILYRVTKNTKVELLEKKGDWGLVRNSAGKEGWAYFSYLSSKKQSEPSKPQKPEEPDPSEENGENDETEETENPEETEQPEQPEESEQTPIDEHTSYTVVLKEESNIREGQGTQYKKIAVEKAGTRLIALGEKDDWVQVQTSKGLVGWVAGWLTVPLGTSGPLKGKVFVLDAGHGGKDPGAMGKITNEKTLNLNTTFEIEKLLKKAGAAVVLTRTNDTYLTLDQRVTISHNIKPDAFISVHYNAATKTSSGVMTFYYSKAKDLQLANAIQKKLAEETSLKNQGVRYGNFHVTRENKYPSVLLELGFISNPTEEKLIATKSYQQKAALGVYKGILDHFKVSE